LRAGEQLAKRLGLTITLLKHEACKRRDGVARGIIKQRLSRVIVYENRFATRRNTEGAINQNNRPMRIVYRRQIGKTCVAESFRNRAAVNVVFASGNLRRTTRFPHPYADGYKTGSLIDSHGDKLLSGAKLISYPPVYYRGSPKRGAFFFTVSYVKQG
jgi:hypothetical protein